MSATTPVRPVVGEPPSDLAAQVGAELQRARGDRPRPPLAAALGWKTDMSLYKLETGRSNPTLAFLERVAACYGGHLEVRFVSDEPRDPAAGDGNG